MTKPKKYDTISGMKTFISKSPEETINYALEFASRLQGGEILALHGDLGSGKTTFTKGLAEGLKINDIITSPTFVLLKEYTFRHAILRPKSHLRGAIGFLVHIDAYRADSIEDIKSVGIEDYFDRSDVVLVIEWAEKIKDILPENVININFSQGEENERKIQIDSQN